MKRLYVGMDLGAKVIALVAKDSRGKTVARAEFETSEKKLIDHIRELPGEVHLMFEECELAGWAYRAVLPYVKRVVVCDPRWNAWISKAANKGDPVDAEKLAELLRIGSYREVYNAATQDMAAFKKAVQQEQAFSRRVARMKVLIETQFRREGIRCEKRGPFSEAGAKNLLEEISNRSVRDLIAQNYRVLGFLEGEKDRARRKVVELSRRIPVVSALQELPGLGPVLSARFVGYVQTPHRFSTKRKLWKYSRLGVVDRSSDGKPIGRKHLDRRANGVLKDVSRKAFDAAMRSKKDNLFRRSYRRSLERTKNATHARLNTQRKILAVMFAIWRDGTVYDDKIDIHRA